MTTNDVDELAKDTGDKQPEEPQAVLAGALDNLVKEVRALNGGHTGKLGLKVNVALRVADAALKRYPPRAG